MKILLIQPPIEDFYQTSIRTQPIGLASLAASLNEKGFRVKILDCQNGKKRSIRLPPELAYLQDFYPFKDRSPFKLYTGFYHFGMDWEEIQKEIKKSGADVFGISSSFTPYHGEALKVARIIKEWDEKKIVIMGGSHICCDPEGVLKSPFVDYVILGEGEVRFPLLLEQMIRGGAKSIERIDGIGYRKDGELRINRINNFIEDLDSLPPPARELLDLDRYRFRKKRSTMIITSRGCPQGCAYCSAHLVMGSQFRVRTPENVLKEMIACREKYGIEVFDIEDDHFTFDLDRARRMMSLIIDTFGESGIELSAMNGISFASLDGELLKLMKRAGFHTLNLSYVSVDSSTKMKIGRPGSTASFEEVLKEAGRAGLHVIAYAILGIPGQTLEEMVDTLIYLMGKRVLIGPSVYYPTPGTPLFHQCQKANIFPFSFSQWRSSALPIETNEFNRLDMVTLLRLTRVINFLKAKMDKGDLEEGITWDDLFLRLEDKIEKSEPCWEDLILMLLRKKSFFSLRKIPSGEFSMIQEKSSRKVLESFLARSRNARILKSGGISKTVME